MWNRRVEMGGGEVVIMHSHSAIVHYLTPNTGTLDLDGSFSHPKSVMRGFAEVDKVESGKPSTSVLSRYVTLRGGVLVKNSRKNLSPPYSKFWREHCPAPFICTQIAGFIRSGVVR